MAPEKLQFSTKIDALFPPLSLKKSARKLREECGSGTANDSDFLNTLGCGVFLKSSFTYTSHFCEENTYLFCRSIANSRTNKNSNSEGLIQVYALFISNHEKVVPIWNQLQSHDPVNYPVCWDYHVIPLVHFPDTTLDKEESMSRTYVFDFDSCNPFPSSLEDYLHASFHNKFVKPQYLPSFRLVAWETLNKNFYSDRSHMKAEDGSWVMKTPDYDCIGRDINPDGSNLMTHFVNMDPDFGYGQVYTLEGLLHRFHS